jgi:hypothetical protein
MTQDMIPLSQVQTMLDDLHSKQEAKRAEIRVELDKVIKEKEVLLEASKAEIAQHEAKLGKPIRNFFVQANKNLSTKGVLSKLKGAGLYSIPLLTLIGAYNLLPSREKLAPKVEVEDIGYIDGLVDYLAEKI